MFARQRMMSTAFSVRAPSFRVRRSFATAFFTLIILSRDGAAAPRRRDMRMLPRAGGARAMNMLLTRMLPRAEMSYFRLLEDAWLYDDYLDYFLTRICARRMDAAIERRWRCAASRRFMFDDMEKERVTLNMRVARAARHVDIIADASMRR